MHRGIRYHLQKRKCARSSVLLWFAHWLSGLIRRCPGLLVLQNCTCNVGYLNDWGFCLKIVLLGGHNRGVCDELERKCNISGKLSTLVQYHCWGKHCSAACGVFHQDTECFSLLGRSCWLHCRGSDAYLSSPLSLRRLYFSLLWL